MLPSAERRASSVKADVDRRVPSEVWLAAADEILDYRPIDAAARLQVPLLVIAVEGDATTPTDHAVQLYEAARGPRALIMQRDTSHYAAYERYGGVVAPRIVDWFGRHLRSGAVEVRSDDGRRDSIEWIEEA
jgi:dipeptidyl aminopeptidase/acylaminoacyl peptidase